MISLIAAVAENGAIGKDNNLLWHLAEDLKFFKAKTTGHPVIMGRKTFESLGRPLPGRRNIVVSRQRLNLNTPSLYRKDGSPSGTVLQQVKDLNNFLAYLKENQGDANVASKEEEFFVIGGGNVYSKAINLADRLYITRIYSTPDSADTFFPPIAEEEWKIMEKSEILHDGENNIDFQFITYIHR